MQEKKRGQHLMSKLFNEFYFKLVEEGELPKDFEHTDIIKYYKRELFKLEQETVEDEV